MGNNTGDDIYLKGNLSILDAAVFNPNNRAVVFCKTSTAFSNAQSISSSKPLELHYVRLSTDEANPDISSKVKLLDNTLKVTAPLEGAAIQFDKEGDIIYLNNQLLSIGTVNKLNTVTGPGSFQGTTGSGANSSIELLGKGSVGTLNFISDLRNFTINREGGKIGAQLGSQLTLLNQLNLQNGILDLYDNTLIIGTGATITQGSPASNNFVIADGDYGGALRKNITNAFSSFLFPIGDNPNSENGMNYSPITIDINKPAVTNPSYIEAKVFDKKLLDSDTNYLSRYWSVTQQNITNPKYLVNAVYNDVDVFNDENTFRNSVYDVATLSWSQQGKTTANTNTISFNNMGNLGSGNTHYITAGEKTKKREISVRGNGIEITSGDTTPDYFDNTYFGTVTPGYFIDKVFRIENTGSTPLNVSSIQLQNLTGALGDFTFITNFSGNIPAGEYREITIRFNGVLPLGDKTALVTINNNDSIKPNFNFVIKGSVNDFLTCNGFTILKVQNFEAAPAYPPYGYTVTEQIADTSSIIAGGRAYANNTLYNKYQDGQSLQVFNAKTLLDFEPVNLINSVDPYLVFSLAAFGYSAAGGLSSGDYVVISVKNPITGVWNAQIRFNAQNGTNWNFGQQTTDYNRVYSTLAVSNINLTAGYNNPDYRYIISGLPKVANLEVRIELYSRKDSEIWALDNVMIVDNTSAKTWNGTSWNGVNSSPPTFQQKAIIDGNLTTTPSTSFSACECEVKAGNTLTIGPDSFVEIQGNITNNGEIIVTSDGNLVQINNDAVNTGDIKVRRAHDLTAERKEYNYLSSPVQNQNMKLIFGNANNVPFVTKLNEPGNNFVNAVTADWAVKAKGFAVKEPRSSGFVDNTGLGQFVTQYTGKPNNGDEIILDLSYTPGRGYNLAGNPYPSNMDLIDLYRNSDPTWEAGEPSYIDPTFRFWDNTVNDIYVQMGGAYQGYSYALFNAKTDLDGFGVAAPGKGGVDDPKGSKIPFRIIKVSQGFMVRARQAGASLKFNNSMRRTSNIDTEFFGRNSTRNRYRLQLVKSDGFTLQNGIAYFAAGNNVLGAEDTRIPNSSASDALFTYAGDAKVVINGRSSFTPDDVLTLGLRHFTAGTYTIQAVDEEGVFAKGQSIYLKDKQLGIITDLTKGDYTFTSDSGEYTNRFEIVYTPALVLATDTVVKSKLEVYRDATDFVIRSSDKAIETMELYDASGRLVLSQKGNGNGKELHFSATRLAEGMYVVKTRLKDGQELTKKIRK